MLRLQFLLPSACDEHSGHRGPPPMCSQHPHLPSRNTPVVRACPASSQWSHPLFSGPSAWPKKDNRPTGHQQNHPCPTILEGQGGHLSTDPKPCPAFSFHQAESRATERAVSATPSWQWEPKTKPPNDKASGISSGGVSITFHAEPLLVYNQRLLHPSCPPWCVSDGDSHGVSHNRTARTLATKFTHHIP